jgi:hypothetical protein
MWCGSTALSARMTSLVSMSRSMCTSTTTAIVMMATLSTTPIRFQPTFSWKNRAAARSEFNIVPPDRRLPSCPLRPSV